MYPTSLSARHGLLSVLIESTRFKDGRCTYLDVAAWVKGGIHAVDGQSGGLFAGSSRDIYKTLSSKYMYMLGDLIWLSKDKRRLS